MKKIILLWMLLIASVASAQSNYAYGTLTPSCNAVTGTGACGALRLAGNSLAVGVTWQLSYDTGTASAVSTTLQGSNDNSTWTTLDTNTTCLTTGAAGCSRSLTIGPYVYLRCNVGTYSRGTTDNLTCAVTVNPNSPGGGNSQTALSGGPYQVAYLPAGQKTGTLANVSDGASASDCTTGGGTNLVPCQWNGSAWTAFTGAVTSGVSSFTGDGNLLTNSASTGAVTASLGTAPTHDFWNGAWTRPASTDISGLGTAATVNTGTSGATIPLLNGNNTYSGTANFSSTLEIGGTTETFPGSGLLVGTTDTQTLSGKSIAGSEINSSVVGAAYGGTGVDNSATLTLGSSNVNFAAFTTGIAKITTTTGAFTDAAAADVYGLWTGTCSSSTYLRGDGACATPAGSGTVNTGTGGAPAVYLTTGTAVSGGSGETFNGSGVLQNVKGASSGTTAAYGDAGTTAAFSQNPGYFGYNTTDTAWEMMTAWQDNSSPALDLQAAYATSQDSDDQNIWNFQYWPVQIAKIEDGVSSSYAVMLSNGDSDTGGFGTTPPQLSWLYPFVTMAESTSTGWGNAGVGYVTSNPVGALKNALPTGVTGSASGSWTYCGWSGGTVTNGIGGTCLGPDATHAAAGANGAYQQITATGTNFFVHAACQSGGASLHIIVDSVDTANASTNCSTPGVVSVASGNLTEGSHVIQAEQVGSGTLVFTGFYGYDTTLGHGIVTLKMGAASTSAANAATNPNFAAEITKVQADLVSVFGAGITAYTEMTGANENNQGLTTASMITAINTLVSAVHTAAPLADIAVFSDPDDGNNVALSASGWQYEKAIQGYDNANRYPFISFLRHTYPESTNSPSNRGCFASDNIHLGPNCQQVMAKTVLRKMNGTLTNPYAGSAGSGTTNYIAKWTSSSVLGNSQLDDGVTNANTLTYAGAGGGAFPNGPLTIATVLKIQEGSVPSGASGYGFIGADSATHELGFSNAGSAFTHFVGSAAALCSTCIMTGGGVQLAQTPNSSSTLDSSGNMTIAGKYNGLTLSGLTGGFSIAGGTSSKTLTIDNTLELAGTDSTKMTFPASSATVAGLGITETFTAPQTFAPSGTAVPIIATGDAASSDVLDVNQHGGSSGNAFKVDHSGNVTAAGNGTFGSAAATAAIGLNTTSGSNSLTTTSGANGYTWTLPAATDTLAGIAASQTLTNKTIAGASNTISGLTGSMMTNNTVTATQLAPQYSKSSCVEVWGGSGTSFALTSGDDAISNNTCYNDSGGTRTITAVKCRSDNASNTTTVNPTFGSAGTGTTILSGALTCGNSYAYSSTGTVSNASWTTGSGIDPAMGGTLTGTSISMIVEYTY